MSQTIKARGFNWFLFKLCIIFWAIKKYSPHYKKGLTSHIFDVFFFNLYFYYYSNFLYRII